MPSCRPFLIALLAFAAAGAHAQTSQQAYSAGAAAFAKGDLPTARQQLEKAVELTPKFELGHSALGAVLLRQGDIRGGIRELELALTLRPGDTLVLQNLAFAYVTAGEPGRAADAYQKLIAAQRAAHQRVTPQTTEAYASALVNAGHPAQAEAVLKQRTAEDPRSATAEDQLGSVYAVEKKWPQATASFRKAIALDPSLALAHMHLSVALHQQQDPGAFAEMERAYNLAPDNPQIAEQYHAAQQDNTSASPEDLRAAYDQQPTADNAWRLGVALQNAGNAAEALPLLQRAADAEPKDAQKLISYGIALCQSQRAKDAVPILQRTVALAPDNASAHQDLAVAYVQLSQFSDAAAELEKALKLAPDSPDLHYNLGLVYKMQDDPTHAIPELLAAEKLNPNAFEPGYVLGILYLQAGQYAQAERELAASLQLQPQNGDGWATMGSVYNNLDKLPQAEDALHKAIEQLPGQSDPHLTLAAVLAKENKAAEATAERHKAAELMKTHMNQQRAEVAVNTGNNLLKQNKLDDARAAFTEALSYGANDNAAHEGLAQVLERQGHAADAAAERQKITGSN